MSTRNICFYEDLTKIIFELSSNTHLISSAEVCLEDTWHSMTCAFNVNMFDCSYVASYGFKNVSICLVP